VSPPRLLLLLLLRHRSPHGAVTEYADGSSGGCGSSGCSSGEEQNYNDCYVNDGLCMYVYSISAIKY
jgi:hypothetical protein